MVEFRLNAGAPSAAPGAKLSVDGVPSQIGGYAALYNVEAVIAGLFREVIAPGAFAESARTSDVLVRVNHLDTQLLGRTSAGTASVREDETGLRYTATINHADPMAVSAAAQIARGDIVGSSFAFEVLETDDEEWIAPRGLRDLPLRILWRLRLIDVAPVVRPAYEGTSVAARADDPIGRRRLARARIDLARITCGVRR